MRLALTLRYTIRSLRRGGERTALAVFCIGVGVMAIVSLQLAAAMVSGSVTSTVRQANGGDVSVVSIAVPLQAGQLQVFRRLQASGLITRWTAVAEAEATVTAAGGHSAPTVVDAVDPAAFPLTGPIGLAAGARGSFRQLVARAGTVVIDSSSASQLHAAAGDRLAVSALGALRTAQWRVGGVISGVAPASFGGTGVLFVGRTTLRRLLGNRPSVYGAVYADTQSAAGAARVARRIHALLPLTTVETVHQALHQDQSADSGLNTFLSIAGLLALLIGGIGIVNTMQVSLSRRRMEIAMLKTTGYRRLDLYRLFGLEAAWLGLAGGIGGALLGTGLSFGASRLLVALVGIPIAFTVSPAIVLSGVGIGVATACIFAVLPIARLSGIRPIAVLRDETAPRSLTAAAPTALLLVLIAALFWLLAAAVLGSLALAFWLVVGTGIALTVLTAIFTLVLWVVGHLPVPERYSVRHLALVTVALLVAVAVARVPVLRAVGAVLIAIALLGYVVVVLPRPFKVVARMALRNLERQRARTATTAVALFVGVFAVGLILIIGTDLRSDLNGFLTKDATDNVFAVAPLRDSAGLVRAATRYPGVPQQTSLAVQVQALTVDGKPLRSVLATIHDGAEQAVLGQLGGIDGFALGRHQLPQIAVTDGRQLRPGDVGTGNVLVPAGLNRSAPRLLLGDRLTVVAPGGGRPVALRVVGFYSPLAVHKGGINLTLTLAPILGARSLAASVGGSTENLVIAFKFPQSLRARAVRALRASAPGAVVIDLTDLAQVVDQFLGNAIAFLAAMASLALLAGIVIIANAVALALLERRRELGIQKAVGHSSGTVLAQVLVETGVVSGLGATFGMIAIALAVSLLAHRALKLSLGIATPLALAIILGAVVVAVLTAALVGWRPVRVRPVEVLRYE
ncbi:MAG TPA: FtsX-like permease family protein [Candidatus Micrarchaeia archaeon]|nr:FtsX-like permease family protein [Candidatus Micrarchaeia archaeon]